MTSISIGVDLHKQQFTTYYFCKNEGFSKKFATNEAGLECFRHDIRRMQENGYRVKVAVESTGNTRYFKNAIEKTGVEVKVINTMKFKVITESVNKTDKRDAKVIAEFLDKDMLPEVHLSSEQSEKLKRLVGVRKELVKAKVKLKNTIHGMLLSFGVETKAGQLNSLKGLDEAITLADDKDDQMIIGTIVDSIKVLMKRIKDIESKLKGLAEGDRVVEILESIPGTGLLTAITVRAYMDDIKKFKKYNKFSAYCGLVPWVQCSDQTQHYGKITKRGPVELRTAIVQMVLGMIRCKSEKHNRIMTAYRNMKKIKGSGKSIVATARKLTKIIWTMLTNDTEYDSKKINAVYDNISKQEKSSAA